MSDFYRFPAMDKPAEWDNSDQIVKMEEELSKARDTYYEVDGEIAYGVKLMDLICDIETALRMNFNDNEVEHLRQLAIEGHRKRSRWEGER